MTGDSTRLRVAQINIGSLLEPDWEHRRHEIVAWLDRLDPDVVCMQEAWEDDAHPNTAGWLADESGTDWHVAFGGAPFGERLWPSPALRFGSAVLSRWPIETEHHVRLPVVGDDDWWLSQAPWELFHVRTADLDVLSTHLAPAPIHGRHRRLQVLAIDEYVRSVRGDRDENPGPGGHAGCHAGDPVR